MGKERPLDYVPVYASIRRHKKTRRLTRALGDFHGKAYWYLIELFLELADEYPNGILPPGFEPEDIADICGWDGDADVFVEALTASGWLQHETDGSWSVINWEEYGGKVLRRRASERVRKRVGGAVAPEDRGDLIDREMERGPNDGTCTDSSGNPTDRCGIPPTVPDDSGGVPAESAGFQSKAHIVESRELRVRRRAEQNSPAQPAQADAFAQQPTTPAQKALAEHYPGLRLALADELEKDNPTKDVAACIIAAARRETDEPKRKKKNKARYLRNWVKNEWNTGPSPASSPGRGWNEIKQEDTT